MDHVRVRDKEQHQQTATPPLHTPSLLVMVKGHETGLIVTQVVTCALGNVTRPTRALLSAYIDIPHFVIVNIVMMTCSYI